MPRKAQNSVLSPSANPLAVCNALRISPAIYFAAMAKFAQTLQTATTEFDRLAGSDTQRQTALRAHVASQIGSLMNTGEAPAPQRKPVAAQKIVAKPVKKDAKAKPVKKNVKAKPVKKVARESVELSTAGRRPHGPGGKGVKTVVSEILQNSSVPMGTDAIEGLVRECYASAGINVPDSIGGQIGTALSSLRKSDFVTAESAGEGRRMNYAWSGAMVAA
jgi:hypothetical protein